ncbi:putative ATP-binding cassette transporter [Hypoxylon rubiginosum]|uniref:ATP-binding cassette transporter n=1 Tax=Hypoxylon rubiginosum TaxID=110542 RepID=A0ACB9YVD5_9PEZI|nr:putative ATP-binding cassette transporter [Hypoxylon rubiginosum]
MSSCSFEADRLFGPAVPQCRRPFDFTLFFEDVFFILIPSCIFVVAAAVRLVALTQRQRQPRVGLGILYVFKLFAVAALVLLELATLILICVTKNEKTAVSVPAAVLTVVATVALAILSFFEHARSRRPSLLIGFYLVIISLLRAVVARTYWFIESGRPAASLTIAEIIVQLAIVALESCSKRPWFIDEGQWISAEETASFLSRSLFTWLGNLFITGYRRQLTALDLHLIDHALSASQLEGKFGQLQVDTNLGRFGLLGMVLRCLGFYAFSPVFPRLCLTGFTFAQPFLASSVIAWIGDQSASDNAGYGLIGASFLVYAGIAFSTGYYWHLSYKCVTKIRGGLLDAIFQKTLRLKQEKGVESKILTLMISDVHRIVTTLAYVHELWTAPLETAIGTWLLWRQVGPSSLTILGIALICTFTSTYIGKHIGVQQKSWLAATERRIMATKNMLSSLKAIKMMGASQRTGLAIEKLRVFEYAASKISRRLLTGSVISSYFTLTLAPVVVFGAYIGATEAANQDLDASRLFSSLILISLVATPLIRLLQIIPSFGAARGCASRLVGFLKRAETRDTRELQRDITLGPNGQAGDKSTFQHKISELDITEDHEVYGQEPIISIRTADLGWEDQPLLKGVNLEVLRGQHVVITGAVGCGKSLLLHAILGEVAPKAGSVYVGAAGIGYCSQVPWLENISARENALRYAPGDESWHKRVISACALQELLDSQMPDGTVGSNGARISGGERQRLALARAIVSRPSILLLDDVFSAIDRSTRKAIMEGLFGQTGILRDQATTVIQITHDPNTARFADRVLTIDERGQLGPFRFLDDDDEKHTNPESTPVPTDTVEKSRANPSEEEKSPQNADRKRTDPRTQMDREVYRTYFRAIGPWHIVTFFTCGIAFAFCLKFPDVWASWWSADAVAESPARSTAYWIGLYALLNTLPLLVVGLWVGHLMLYIVPTSGVGLHKTLLNSVLNATFAFIGGVDSGSLINRFNQDLMLVDMKLPLDLLNTAAELFTCIIMVVLVAVAAVYVLAVLPAVAVTLFGIQHFYLRTSKQLRQLELQSKSGLHTSFSELYTGLVSIRAHGWQTTMQHEFWEKVDGSQEPQYLLWMVQCWLRLTLNLVVAGLSVLVVGVAIAMRHSTNAGAIGVAFLNMVNLGETMTTLISSWTSLETSLGAIARINAFEKDTSLESDVTTPANISPEWPSFGQIKFDHVWASYHSDQEKPIWSLQDVSLQINAGEKIAVCGRSGSGKSTLLLSLLALIDTPRGTISLDGVDISHVRKSHLRSRFSVISQDTFVSSDIVREALDPESELPDGTIMDVLGECAILNKITAAGGLSAKLSDINMSVGESQLFGLARTILHSGSRQGGGVVLLDEATSSIDVATELKIMDLIARRLDQKTIISILHRLEASLEYDRILVMEKGQVAHFGTPAEVIRDSELFSSFRKS